MPSLSVPSKNVVKSQSWMIFFAWGIREIGAYEQKKEKKKWANHSEPMSSVRQTRVVDKRWGEILCWPRRTQSCRSQKADMVIIISFCHNWNLLKLIVPMTGHRGFCRPMKSWLTWDILRHEAFTDNRQRFATEGWMRIGRSNSWPRRG